MITAHLEVDKKARWLYAEKQRDLGLSSGQWYVSLHFPPSVWFYWFCSGESWFNGPWPANLSHHKGIQTMRLQHKELHMAHGSTEQKKGL